MSEKLIRGVLGFGLIVLFAGLSPERATAEDAPKLRYGFQKDGEYWYDAKISAEFADEEITYEGSLLITVTSASEEEFALRCNGGLHRSSSASSNTVPQPPTRFYPSRSRMSSPRYTLPPLSGLRYQRDFSLDGTTFNRLGSVVKTGEKNYLPLFLGYEVNLIIEMLPETEKSYWESRRDVAVIERDDSSAIIRPIGGSTIVEKHRVAREQTDYSVLGKKADSIRIGKKYSLKTVEEGGIAYLDMSGKGEFEFDPKEGLIKSQSMKYEIRISEKNVVLTIPVEMSYKVRSKEEVAEMKKKIAEARIASEKRAEAERPKPFRTGEREQLLKDLGSGNSEVMQAAAKRLQKVQPVENPKEICLALCQAYKNTNGQVQADVFGALKPWITSDAEQTVIEASKSKNYRIEREATSMLRGFKTADSAKAAAMRLLEHDFEAQAVLKAIGPVAEPTVLLLLKDNNQLVRSHAAEVLAEIGTKKCLPHLNDALSKAPDYEKHAFQNAINAIEKRMAFEENALDLELEEANMEAKPRIWTDATGTYKVKATYIESKGNNVTIKKADGKTVTLTIEKLSKADQEYVEQQVKAQAAKPENPFE
jgi:hypothetical protein